MIKILYGITICLSAFLLFFIQPLIAKVMLPYFGGSGFVWMATILFFQMVLLLGYGYAYVLTKFFSDKLQAIIHVILLAVSFYFIPIHLHYDPTLETLWSPLAVLSLLTLSILLPCTVISASSPLLQHWYCRLRQTSFPYIFYSISNAGSLLGLLGYPFLLEPLIGLKSQQFGWSLFYGIYAVLCLLCLVKLFSQKIPKNLTADLIKTKLSQKLKWLVLTFLSSALLLSTTQFLVQNVLNMPLLWVLPLALYLISYIVIFSKPKNYDREFWAVSFMIWLVAILWLINHMQLGGINVVIVILALLFSACMVCHGELIKLKPQTDDLTLFYLFIALGGVLGGIFSNIVALLIFKNWWDYYIPLISINLIICFLFVRQYVSAGKLWDRLLALLSMVVVTILAVVIFLNIYMPKEKLIAQFRNPYGFIRVYDFQLPTPFRVYMHGMVIHGLQFKAPSKEFWPTTYYGHTSGVGVAFEFLREKKKPLHIGIIGLGCGILAAYGEMSEHFTFYEIDKDSQTAAREYFTFLKGSKANIQVQLADARIQLQHELKTNGSQQYNMLVVDAFNGDAIPFHLLTVEAMALYQQHLSKDGIIAIHTSNTYLNFLPVTAGLAQHQGCSQYWIASPRDGGKGLSDATWSLISCDPTLGAWLQEHHLQFKTGKSVTPILWTDDFNTVLPLLKLGLTRAS